VAEKQLVLSFFADRPEADAAAMSLKDSGITCGDAIGASGPRSSPAPAPQLPGADLSTLRDCQLGACLFVLGPAFLGVGVLGGTLAGGATPKGLKHQRCRQGADRRRPRRR
jgi:hypothetical protein